MQQSLKIVVSGRVQGVFFRASCKKKAQQLGIKGFARNLSDGRVEIVAEGPSAAMEQFIAWCRRGPAMANVEKLNVARCNSDETFQYFEIR